MGALAVLLADGRLPTGGHAHSAGLEAAVRLGEVTDVEGLARFAAARLDTQGRVDAAFAAATVSRWHGPDRRAAVAELCREYDARTVSPHLRAAGRTLGRHLVRVADRLLGDDGALRAQLADAPRPIVAGALAAAAGLDVTEAAVLECHHLVAAVCGGAVKLLALDPLAVVEVQARLTASIDAVAADAAASARCHPADLAAVTSSRADLLAEWHAADPARLFAT